MTAVSLASRLSELPREAVLRLVLKLDAAVTGANGIAYLAAAEPLEELLGLEATLTRPVGAFLLLFACGVWQLATRPTVTQGGTSAVIAVNVLWTVGSIVAAAPAVSSPTTVGSVWIVVQAVVVGGFAALQGYARSSS